MAIPYVKQTWVDGAGGGTPVSAARLAVLEQGIYDAHRMPAARVYNSVDISIPNNTETAVTFNSERFDTDTIHDTVTNTSRLTCKTAGIYAITAQATFAGSAGSAYRQISIRLNGTTWLEAVGVFAAAVPGIAFRAPTVTTLYPLAVNDYVEMTAQQDSGGALNVLALGNYSPEFSMVRVSS